MIAYYSPTALTNETIMLSKSPACGYSSIDTDELGYLGYKKAYLDGQPIPIKPTRDTNANKLYFQLFLNTKQRKWIEKIDAGKLFVPVLITEEQVKKLYRRIDDKHYTLAFLSKDDFYSFDKDKKYQEYKPIYSDRTEKYIVNGVIINK